MKIIVNVLKFFTDCFLQSFQVCVEICIFPLDNIYALFRKRSTFQNDLTSNALKSTFFSGKDRTIERQTFQGVFQSSQSKLI